MSLKENLQTKIRLGRLFKKIADTMRETPGQRKLNKEAMRELLSLTDFRRVSARDLQLYARPLQGDIEEILVLDNEIPLYHTTIADVAMRKTPHWKEMFSIRNVRKILNDQDVVASRGKASLQRVFEVALERLDLSSTAEEVADLAAQGCLALETKDADRVRESLDLFVELLGLEPLYLEVLEPGMHAVARTAAEPGPVQVYEDVIVFGAQDLTLGLMKGAFAPGKDLQLARLLRCVRGETPFDLQGEQVFQFLAGLATAG